MLPQRIIVAKFPVDKTLTRKQLRKKFPASGPTRSIGWFEHCLSGSKSLKFQANIKRSVGSGDMVSQLEILDVVGVGEALTAEQILERLPGSLKLTELSKPLTRLPAWGQLKFVVVGESSRGEKIWGYRRLW